MKWALINQDSQYWDFEKEVLLCADKGYTTLDVRLTFDADSGHASMCVMWRNNDGNTQDLGKERSIEWNAAIELIETDLTVPDAINNYIQKVTP
jgi:hypothetical protein